MPEITEPLDEATTSHPHEPEIDRQLDDDIRGLASKNAALAEDVQAWRNHTLEDADSQAIAACVRALDPLANGRGDFGTGSKIPKPSIARILDHLAARYSVNTEPRLQQLIDGLTTELRRLRETQPAPYSVPLPNIPPGYGAPAFQHNPTSY